jgi:uncharacterized membrane protein (UPF0127 family)
MRSPRTFRITLILAALSATLTACGGTADAPRPSGTLTFTTSGGQVRMPVEIADTPDARRRGLMDRTSLPDDAGMAFLFDEPGDGGFWMKDTSIPLSIAFWDGRGRILAVLDMPPCERDPCPVYAPGVTYVGAVEANRGYFEQHGIAKGDLVALQR